MTSSKDLPTIRKTNTMLLLNNFRTKKEFAEAIDVSPSQLTHIFNADKNYNIGSKLARKIEEGNNKPVGWLDVDHTLEPDPLICIDLAVDAVIALHGVLKENKITIENIVPEVYSSMLTDVMLDASKIKSISGPQVQTVLLSSHLSKITN